MSIRTISYVGAALVIVIAVAVFVALSPSSLDDASTESRPDTGVEEGVEGLVPVGTESISTSGDEVLTLSMMTRLCPNPFGDVSDECARALDRRYLDEGIDLEPLHYDSVGWRSRRDDLRNRLTSPLLALDTITWRQVFDDPEGIHGAVRGALREPECLVVEGQVRPTQRARCAADEMAKLAMLHEGCVMPLVMHGRYNPWRPEGDDDVWDGPSQARSDEDWHTHVEELDNQVDLPPDEYWHRREEIDDAKLRFAWRLRKCTAVPEVALSWLDALPAPTGETGDQHQAEHLLALAGRLGSHWAQFRSRQSPVDLGALREVDPALAYFKAGTMGEGRVADLVVAVEYAKRSGKEWFDVAVQTLKSAYTPEEIRSGFPHALSMLQVRGVAHTEPEWWQTLTSGSN